MRFGYPEAEHELMIFKDAISDPLKGLTEEILSRESLRELSRYLDKIYVSDRVAKYIKIFVDSTRANIDTTIGISTRGGLSWVRMAKGIALLNKRSYVLPDDLQYLAICCLSHCISTKKMGAAEKVINEILENTQVE